jgi:phosphonate transport system ATP-binding protein
MNLHQVEFAKKYATRIIGIKEGKVVYDGTPENLDDETINYIYKGKEDEMTLKAQATQTPIVSFPEATGRLQAEAC